MPAYRLRASLRFRPGNGLAQWSFDQNTVRLGQAYHLNQGTAAEERSKHSAVSDVYTCDLIFPTEALAIDTWATLIAICLDVNLQPPTQHEATWMDMHACGHDAAQPCPTPTRVFNNLLP